MPGQRRDGLESLYLRPRDLRRLEHAAFSSRRRVEGLYAGSHATPQRGQSIEFRDYRQYMPGDEVGNVDWKVYGRSDRLFIKVFEHQAEWTVNLVVDASASMSYRGMESRSGRTADSKYDYACRLAAAISFLILRQQDRVSLAIARRGLANYVRSAASIRQLPDVLRQLERTVPDGEARLADALREVTGRSGRRELFVVLGDLLDDREAVLKTLSVCLSRGGEALLFHVLHADELSLPDLEHGTFIDSETGGTVRLNVADIRPAYEARMKEFLDGWSKACRGLGVEYRLCPTSTPYFEVLERYLGGRPGRSR